jgi:hypothetical protein
VCTLSFVSPFEALAKEDFIFSTPNLPTLPTGRQADKSCNQFRCLF